jgi:hypothetical protein
VREGDRGTQKKKKKATVVNAEEGILIFGRSLILGVDGGGMFTPT